MNEEEVEERYIPSLTTVEPHRRRRVVDGEREGRHGRRIGAHCLEARVDAGCGEVRARGGKGGLRYSLF